MSLPCNTINLHRHLAFLVECMGDKQTRISHIAFESVAFHIETQPQIGCGAVVADVHDSRIGKPEESIVVVAVGRINLHLFKIIRTVILHLFKIIVGYKSDATENPTQRKGFPPSDIAELTGLDIEAVRKL